MKLNNNGWGLKEMILYSSVLLIFLVVAAVLIYRLYNGLEREISNDTFSQTSSTQKSSSEEKPMLTYETIEENIRNASIDYYNDYYSNGINDTLTIKIENLVNDNYLEQPYDTEDNSKCSGYALVKDTNEELTVEPFLKCSNYTTKGYQSWRIGG